MFGRVDRVIGSDGTEKRWYHNRLSGRVIRLTFRQDGTYETSTGGFSHRFAVADIGTMAAGIVADVRLYPPAVIGWR